MSRRNAVGRISRAVGLAVLAAALHGGCRDGQSGQDRPITTDEAPRDPCPPGMRFVEGGRFTLGESEPSRITADPYDPGGFSSTEIVLRSEFDVASFCMDEYPFPGTSGDSWPTDGLSLQDAVVFDVKISRSDRRLCSITELLLAGAGPENWRYPYNPEIRREGVCEVVGSIGSQPECVSPLGFHDFMIQSTWGNLTDPVLRDACAADLGGTRNLPGGGSYAVWGGNYLLDTFYSPNNFGIHFHSFHEGAYDDDGVRTCADPATWSPRSAAAWKALTEEFRATGSFQSFLYGS